MEQYILTNLLNKVLQNQTIICNNVVNVKQRLDNFAPVTSTATIINNNTIINGRIKF